MGKYEKTTTPDEMVDEELRGLGVKFQDHTKDVPKGEAFFPVPDQMKEKVLEYWKKCRAKAIAMAGCGLVAADGLLIYMCMTGKIELAYGLVFLAAASAFFGGRLHRACV